MKEKWKVFLFNGEEIGGYTIRGEFTGEEENTKKLLAEEVHCLVQDITTEIVYR